MEKVPDSNSSETKPAEPDFDSIPMETKVWIHGAIEKVTERAWWLIAIIVLIMSIMDKNLFSINGIILFPLILYLGFLIFGVLSPLIELKKGCSKSISIEDQQEIYARICGALPTIRDAAKAGVATVIFLAFAFYFS